MHPHLSDKAIVWVQISMDHVHGMQVGLDKEHKMVCTDKLIHMVFVTAVAAMYSLFTFTWLFCFVVF